MINLATYYMIRTVCQNPCFSKTWCRVAFISVAPGNPSLTSLVFASVSLLGLVCITAGHFSGLDGQFGAFSQISRRSLDRVPVLCSSRPPLPRPPQDVQPQEGHLLKLNFLALLPVWLFLNHQKRSQPEFPPPYQKGARVDFFVLVFIPNCSLAFDWLPSVK